VDAAIAAARKITDTKQRIAAYQAVDKTIGEALPDIPLMFYKHHHVTSARVHGFVFSSMYLADFTNTWISGGASTSTTKTP
jgi:peptide/nickel transport system substrate-binding protein/oligopeptide transport system substrate-binding protein